VSLANILKKTALIFSFIWLYISDLVKTAFLIAWDVLTVKDYSKPGFIEVPLAAKTDLEIALIANLITFSPGTMVVGLSDDRQYMRVHVMFLESSELAIADIKNNLERRVLEVLR